jgi:hypothetical protein
MMGDKLLVPSLLPALEAGPTGQGIKVQQLQLRVPIDQSGEVLCLGQEQAYPARGAQLVQQELHAAKILGIDVVVKFGRRAAIEFQSSRAAGLRTIRLGEQARNGVANLDAIGFVYEVPPPL